MDGGALYLALLIVGAVLTGIVLVQSKGTELLAWAVAAIDAALLLRALG